jgi:hypothetical protein
MLLSQGRHRIPPRVSNGSGPGLVWKSSSKSAYDASSEVSGIWNHRDGTTFGAPKIIIITNGDMATMQIVKLDLPTISNPV